MLLRLWEIVQRILATILVVPSFSVVLTTGILIRLASPGPLFFRQEREGWHGVQFSMLKLRTMVVNAEEKLGQHLASSPGEKEEWEAYGRLSRDPRVAGRIARFARRSSIDELPQLINVVKGEMNLVGPRPLPISVVTKMRSLDRNQRQQVRPGITGLWQVSGRSELDIENIGYLDSSYVTGRSVALDLRIIARTFHAVLGRRGAY